MKKSERKIDKATQMLITSASELYLGEHKNQYGLIENDVYCIPIDTLVKEEKLSVTIKEQENFNVSFVKITVGSNKNLSYEAVESCTEVNTTPSIPNEPDITPSENSKAPVIEFTGSDIIPDTQTTFDALEGVIITDDNTPRSEIKVNVIGEVSLGIIGKYPIVYEAIDKDSNVTTKTRIIEVLKTEYVFPYTGSYQEFTVLKDGNYQIELWGAQGGKYTLTGGNGAYAKGILSLKKDDKLYIYVGANGSDGSKTANFNPSVSFNGGGSGGNSTCSLPYSSCYVSPSGGGATDIRIFEETPSADNLLWNSELGLRSRIIVAAGGGGAGHSSNGGAGGTLNGIDSVDAAQVPYGVTKSMGGTQISGGSTSLSASGSGTYVKSENGSFGKGGNSTPYKHSGGGGGGGYYGGGAGGSGGQNTVGAPGAGGSSFISGYLGCVAVTSKDSTAPKSGCSNGTTDLTCSYHYSGYVFKNSIMKAGNEEMPTHDGTSTMTGNTGDGYAKITYIIE